MYFSYEYQDNFGNSFDLDIVLNALFFEINKETGIVWNHNSWGHIILPQLKQS